MYTSSPRTEAGSLSIARLSSDDAEALVQLYLELDTESRYRRFGFSMPDASLQKYINSIQFHRDCVLGAFEDGRLVGACEALSIGVGRDKATPISELAFVVSPEFRGRSVGWRLGLEILSLRAGELVLSCATPNTAMVRLADKLGFYRLAATRDTSAMTTSQKESVDTGHGAFCRPVVL